MHGRYNKLDVAKALKLRALGLSNTIIGKRLGVTQGAVCVAFSKYNAEHGVDENLRPQRRTPCWA